MIGCLIPDVKDVSELAPILLVPQLLFAGTWTSHTVTVVYLLPCLPAFLPSLSSVCLPDCLTQSLECLTLTCCLPALHYHSPVHPPLYLSPDCLNSFLKSRILFNCTCLNWVCIICRYDLLSLNHITHTGFFIRTSLIPIYMRWAQYLCAIKYSVNLVLLTEFNLMNKSCQGDAMVNCHVLLATNNIVEGNAYIYVLLLFAIFVFFRGLGAIILIQKAKRFY